ncbi:S-layer homology domain-containing protein [Acetivibrio thermocellus]|uniref:S-layer homology domain-containing protein n=1 Tax=Acetivibrio thermocellus TaxID=1515 RepID=UPI0010A5FBB9|nr:S-layer homology domain-containing protein [Acetivibrio thermocellus]THJ76658.1 S-layer homology domain-containing protein [Acetivibrio thermocellus]
MRAEPPVDFKGFNDIEGHWAQFWIELNAKLGNIAGYEDSSFRPSQSVTRAEFVTMANRFFDIRGSVEFGCSFTDVNENDWFFADVATAEKAGYISGYPDGTFRPNALITREEAAVILCRLTNRAPSSNTDSIEFTDSDSISPWALGYVKRLVFSYIIKGYPDNTFRPKNPVTRAEAVVLVDNTRLSLMVPPIYPPHQIPGSYGESPSSLETATPSPTPTLTQEKTGDKQTGKEPSKTP